MKPKTIQPFRLAIATFVAILAFTSAGNIAFARPNAVSATIMMSTSTPHAGESVHFDGSASICDVPQGCSYTWAWFWQSGAPSSPTTHTGGQMGRTPIIDYTFDALAASKPFVIVVLTVASGRIGPRASTQVTFVILPSLSSTPTAVPLPTNTPTPIPTATPTPVVTTINANPDAGQITSFGGGTAIANVIANDFVNGAGATTANAQLSFVSSSSPKVTLNLASGSVNVAVGTPSGTHTLVYRICAVFNTALCSQATATVTIPRYAIVANNDQGTAPSSTGGVAVVNVLLNDTFGGFPATGQVQATQLSTTNPGVSLNAATGTGLVSVNVAAGTPFGTQTLTYQICEIADPTHCAPNPATVTVTVLSYAIDAVNDSVRASSKTPGILLPNVLANDTFAGGPATLAAVRLSQISLTPSTPDIQLNVATGAVTLANKVSGATYTLVYQICEINTPTNCDQATVTLDLSGK